MIKVNNQQVNIIRKGLDKLEHAYKQSTDEEIRTVVKEKVYLDLAIQIPMFDETFEEAFGKCRMRSLREIDELRDEVFAGLDIAELPQLSEKQIKKMFKKLPDKYIRQIYNDYNAKASARPLTYYSLKVDDGTKVFIFYENNEFFGEVVKTTPNVKGSSMYCQFCTALRMGPEIGYITKVSKSKAYNYRTKTVPCCVDGIQCNNDIVDTGKIKEFFELKENENNGENCNSN